MIPYINYKSGFTSATEGDPTILPTKAKAADCHKKCQNKSSRPKNYEKLKILIWQL